jgi:hypothetical protein
MPRSSNRISNFWQELKRRKVTRTITVYAAAAFVILELLSIIIEPLRLPGRNGSIDHLPPVRMNLTHIV